MEEKDYSKYEGSFFEEPLDLTFEPLEVVLYYLHYGNRLTLIEFNEEDSSELENCTITKDTKIRIVFPLKNIK